MVCGKVALWYLYCLLFNLSACVVVERWLERVCDVEGVRTCLFYRYSQELFRRYTRNVSESVVHRYM